MKLILESTDMAMLIEKSALLQSKGIPTHMDDVPHVGAVPSHLYVLIDEHFDDATALLDNSDHVVANPLFPEDLEAMSSEFEEASHASRDEKMPQLMAGFFLCVATAAVVRWLGASW